MSWKEAYYIINNDVIDPNPLIEEGNHVRAGYRSIRGGRLYVVSAKKNKQSLRNFRHCTQLKFPFHYCNNGKEKHCCVELALKGSVSNQLQHH